MFFSSNKLLKHNLKAMFLQQILLQLWNVTKNQDDKTMSNIIWSVERRSRSFKMKTVAQKLKYYLL